MHWSWSDLQSHSPRALCTYCLTTAQPLTWKLHPLGGWEVKPSKTLTWQSCKRSDLPIPVTRTKQRRSSHNFTSTTPIRSVCQRTAEQENKSWKLEKGKRKRKETEQYVGPSGLIASQRKQTSVIFMVINSAWTHICLRIRSPEMGFSWNITSFFPLLSHN